MSKATYAFTLTYHSNPLTLWLPGQVILSVTQTKRNIYVGYRLSHWQRGPYISREKKKGKIIPYLWLILLWSLGTLFSTQCELSVFLFVPRHQPQVDVSGLLGPFKQMSCPRQEHNLQISRGAFPRTAGGFQCPDLSRRSGLGWSSQAPKLYFWLSQVLGPSGREVAACFASSASRTHLARTLLPPGETSSLVLVGLTYFSSLKSEANQHLKKKKKRDWKEHMTKHHWLFTNRIIVYNLFIYTHII